MVKKFTAQVDDIIKVNQTRLTALARQSTQELVDRAQLSDDKEGGDMRVDTGFLRASGQMSLTGMPAGETRGDPDQNYDFDKNSTVTVLSNYELGMNIYFGWTASYARIRNTYDGFLDKAVQDWPNIVAKVTAEIRKLVK